MAPNPNQTILVVDDSSTIRKVVGRTLERAGYRVVTAADGREGLEQAQKHVPDLVLVDFVMPHMNGFQLCQALRGVSNLREVPIVLMSVKADKIADQFITQTGAVDAITKPFSPEVLLAVAVNVLGKSARDGGNGQSPTSTGAIRSPRDTVEMTAGAVEAAMQAAAASGEIRLVAETSGQGMGESTTQPDLVEAERLAARRRAMEKLAAVIGPAVRRIFDASVPTDATLANSMDGVTDEDLLLLGELLRRLSGGERGAVSFEGRIDHVALGDVLQLVQLQKQTGVLVVERGERTVSVCLRQGLVDIALARGQGSEFLLGRYLIENELVEKEDLETLLRQRGGERRLLGAHLVKLGYITTEDLRSALVRQTSELVYEALRWKDGVFRFEQYATRPEAHDAKLALPVANILMEGLRRVDEWRLIEEQIPRLDIVLGRDEEALLHIDADALHAEERRVLDAVDGKRTVREVIDQVRMGSFEVCKVLFQLSTSRLVKERAQAK